jgi:hypothetical protein
MLNRALVSATVMLLIGCFAAAPAQAQNLEAGKSPSQIFAGTCNVCHKSPRGLLKTMSAGALPGFLRQHYTTSPEMAGLLSSYLVSNGAVDKRYQGRDAKSDGKPEGQPGGAPPQLDRQGRPVHTSAPVREPAKPQAEQQPSVDTAPQDEGARKGRRRLARPMEEGATPAEDETAVRNVGERGPDGRKLGAKQRLSKRGRPGEEVPKSDVKGDAAKTDSGNEAPAAPTATREDKPAAETTKDEGATSPDKSSDKPSAETAKVESPKETAPKAPAGQTPALQADPVPAVTPAPAALPASAAASGGSSEPAAGSSAKPAAPPAAASAPAPAQSAASEPASAQPAAASAPASAPAGPPQAPISR